MAFPVLSLPKEKEVWLYFLDARLRYLVVVFFGGLVLVETDLGKPLLLIGFLWLGGVLKLNQSRPSDRDLDRLFSSKLDPLAENAGKNFDARSHEMSAVPLVLRGPVELDAPAFYHYFTRPKTGEDGARRSPVNRVAILLPLEDCLGIYCFQHDFLRGESSQVSIEELHYRDIVAMTLEKESEMLDGPALQNGAALARQVLSFDLKGGRRLSFPVSVGQADSSGASGEESSMSDLERTMKAIQVLLRDRR